MNIRVQDDQIKDSINKHAAVYQHQLKSYLSTYTAGELHARITLTKSDGSIELMRDIVTKGKNNNPNRSLDLKA